MATSRSRCVCLGRGRRCRGGSMATRYGVTSFPTKTLTFQVASSRALVSLSLSLCLCPILRSFFFFSVEGKFGCRGRTCPSPPPFLFLASRNTDKRVRLLFERRNSSHGRTASIIAAPVRSRSSFFFSSPAGALLCRPSGVPAGRAFLRGRYPLHPSLRWPSGRLPPPPPRTAA